MHRRNHSMCMCVASRRKEKTNDGEKKEKQSKTGVGYFGHRASWPFCQLLTTWWLPTEWQQAVGKCQPSTHSLASQSSFYCGIILPHQKSPLSSMASLDFTSEYLHLFTPSVLMLGSSILFGYNVSLNQLYFFQNSWGKHRERGGQGKLKYNAVYKPYYSFSESWLNWCLKCRTKSWVKNILWDLLSMT